MIERSFAWLGGFVAWLKTMNNDSDDGLLALCGLYHPDAQTVRQAYGKVNYLLQMQDGRVKSMPRYIVSRQPLMTTCPHHATQLE